MISKCKSCDSNLNRNRPGVQCSFCESFYHANTECCELKKEQAQLFRSTPGSSWICQSCRTRNNTVADARSSRNNTLADARSTRNSTDFGNAFSGNTNGEINNMNAMNMPSINSRRSSIGVANDSLLGSSLETELRLLRDSVSFCSDKITDFEEILKQLALNMKQIDLLKSENMKLKSDVNTLTNKLDALEQHSRNNNIEIHGVPEVKNENLFNVLDGICKFINIDVNTSHIDYIHRISTRNTDLPKPIIVRFTSRLYKENLIGAARTKQKKDINNTTSGLLLEGAHKPIFINENLTNDKKLLFKECRKFAKDNKYKFSWVKNGNIFLRKDDNTKVHLISSSAVLNKLHA